MKYMGSKNRIAKNVLPIILNGRTEGQWYVEPFVGGANMLDKVTGERIGADLHYYLIAVMDALSKGWTPPKIVSESDYQDMRINKESYPPEVIGFVGFACSYAAKWFGGYCRGFDSKGNARDYIMEAWRNVEKQKPNINGVLFVHSGYYQLVIPSNSIIYCDPPYRGATGYKDKFDHDIFWQWCRDKSAEGHSIYISEYSAPEDFRCVWQKEINSSLTKDTGSKKAIEKLFII